MKNILAFLFTSFLSSPLFAQNSDIEMADGLRSNGKIYVVVICIVIILIGLLLYLFGLDKRIKKLEKKYKK